jgi:hypothetical protein
VLPMYLGSYLVLCGVSVVSDDVGYRRFIYNCCVYVINSSVCECEAEKRLLCLCMNLSWYCVCVCSLHVTFSVCVQLEKSSTKHDEQKCRCVSVCAAQ